MGFAFKMVSKIINNILNNNKLLINSVTSRSTNIIIVCTKTKTLGFIDSSFITRRTI